MMRADVRPRGVLDEEAARGLFETRRVLPSAELEAHIAYFWLVRWRLQTPYEQHALPLPAAHYVFEQNDVTFERMSRAVGPTRRRFTRRLEGSGHILGIAFHAGSGAPWLRAPMRLFIDRPVPLGEVLQEDLAAAHRSILGARDDARAVAAAERFAKRHLPVLDAESRLARRLMERLWSDRGLLRIEQLIEASGLSERALQRLFARCVGLPPKAVIRRFRLVEAADRLARPRPPRLTTLAQELGYFDQSHFIRDFRSLVGRSPLSSARGTGK